MAELYTNSRLGTFRECPRKHQLAYAYGLRPAVVPDYMTVGTLYHALHEGADIATADPFLAAQAHAMYEGWTPRLIAEQGYVAVELRMESVVGAHRYGGAVDAVVRLTDGRLAVLERKTTATLDDDYWRRVELDSQITGYFVLARAAGYAVETIVYDVVERPGCKRLRATKVIKLKKDGEPRAGQREQDETPEEHLARCCELMVPEKYSMREVAVGAQRIREWERDAAEQVRAIESGFVYRNTSACTRRGSVCEYLGICHRSDLDENAPGGFVRLTDMHPELARAGLAAP